jgi:cell division protein DivIC
MLIPRYTRHIILAVLFIVAAVNFTKTTLDVMESSKRLDTLRSDVVTLEEKRGRLEEELTYKKTESFIEKEARNKLGLVRPGEQVFVVRNVLGDESYRAGDTVDTGPVSNVRMWIDLFF